MQLYDLTNIEVVFRHKGSSIVYKRLSENLMDKEIFLSSAAILYIGKGRQVIKNYDGKQVVVQQGELVYLARDMYLVSDFVTDKGMFEAVLFFLSDDFIKKRPKKENFDSISGNHIPVLQPNLQVVKYIESLLSVYFNHVGDCRILELKLSEFLLLIESQQEGMAFLSRLDGFPLSAERQDIRTFMNDNYLKNLKVEDYAKLTGRSKSTFVREFKRIYGNTPNRWLIEQRLEKAHQILTTSSISVTDTAFEVGYENVSHFISAYKKRFNITPKQSKKDVLTQISY